MINKRATWTRQPQYPTAICERFAKYKPRFVVNAACDFPLVWCGVTSRPSLQGGTRAPTILGQTLSNLTTSTLTPVTTEIVHPSLTMIAVYRINTAPGTTKVNAGFKTSTDQVCLSTGATAFAAILQRNGSGPSAAGLAITLTAVAGRTYFQVLRSSSDTGHVHQIWSSTGEYGTATVATDTTAVSFIDPMAFHMGESGNAETAFFGLFDGWMTDEDIQALRDNINLIYEPVVHRSPRTVAAAGTAVPVFYRHLQMQGIA